MSVTFTHEIVKGQVDISDVVTVGFSVCLTQFDTLGRDLAEWINRARSTANYIKSEHYLVLITIYLLLHTAGTQE